MTIKELDNSRYCSRRPSQLMTELLQYYPNLYDTEDLILCDRTPVNMVNALLIQTVSGGLLKELIRRGYDIDKLTLLKKSIEIFEQVAIIFPAGIGEVTVPYVLHKSGCGLYAGVVLSGELAGLIVNTKPLIKKDDKPVHPLRVWNDDLICDTKAYDPGFLLEFAPQYLAATKLQSSHPDHYNQTYRDICDILTLAYSLLANRYEYLSEAFFGLCHDILPPEVARQMRYQDFHFTRSLSSGK